MWCLSLSLCVNFRRGTSAGCLQITGLVFPGPFCRNTESSLDKPPMSSCSKYQALHGSFSTISVIKK